MRTYVHIIGISAYLLLTTYWMMTKIQNQQSKQIENALLLHKNDDLFDIFDKRLKLELFGQELFKHGKHGLLLCFIEMIQLKSLIKYNYRISRTQHVIQRENGQNVNQHWSEFQSLMQRSYIPKSSLIHDSQIDFHHFFLSTKCILKIIYCLYRKYIENAGSLQLHLSDMNMIRSNYNKIKEFDFPTFNKECCHMNKTELFEYFDPIIDEVYNSLSKEIESIQEQNISNRSREKLSTSETIDNSELIPLKQQQQKQDNDNQDSKVSKVPSLYGVITQHDMELLYALYLKSKVKFYKTSSDLGLFDSQVEIVMEYFAKMSSNAD